MTCINIEVTGYTGTRPKSNLGPIILIIYDQDGNDLTTNIRSENCVYLHAHKLPRTHKVRVWTTKFDTVTWSFRKIDMRHRGLVTQQEGETYSDMRHCHFLKKKSTGDIHIP